jgi:hypothetical protein
MDGGKSPEMCVLTDDDASASAAFGAPLDQSQPMDETGMLRPENWVSRK